MPISAASSDEPFVTRLRGAEKRSLDLIGFAADDRATVDALAVKLGRDGVKLISEPHRLDSPGGGYGFRCFDLDGHVLEISSDVTPGAARELNRGESIPAILSHIVLHTPDLKKAVAFYEEHLGFKVSDWLGDFMCFLRCNEVHHSIAFLPGPPCLNHVAYEMRDIDEMMRGAGRLLKAKVPLKWGPGRHTAGNNTFSYFFDPAGNSVEYTAAVDRVDDATWKPTIYPPASRSRINGAHRSCPTARKAWESRRRTPRSGSRHPSDLLPGPIPPIQRYDFSFGAPARLMASVAGPGEKKCLENGRESRPAW